MTLLIAFVSIKMMEDRQLERKGRAFLEYRRKVGSALLLLPPTFNRLLGRCLYGSDDEDDDDDNINQPQ
eukprot:CAMPEP_0194187536 /NCGR_PEP_ID=MMETSP0154-20130528/51323_1 /TAXON_ID=1049557 /ORGANISM="Thalassiothrix antarctica, Strain L6-D1" /LENGTH=68 /DNA_ID=CAMNT_0038907327 /DNA_START=307 /DNA_END=516 /DNA_ORIENTATION=+